MANSGILAGKRGLIMGVANDRSIAWGIAQSVAAQGAELAFTYQGDAFRKRVLPLVEPLRPSAIIDCDVSSPQSLDHAFDELAEMLRDLRRIGFRGVLSLELFNREYWQQDALAVHLVEYLRPHPHPDCVSQSLMVQRQASHQPAVLVIDVLWDVCF